MHNRRWIGDDLHNLLYCTPKDLRIIYPGHNWDSLRAKRKLFRKKVKRGEIMAPKRSEDYPGAEAEHERAKQRRAALAKPAGQAALSEMISLEGRRQLHDQLDAAIDKYNLPPEHVEALRIKRISTWNQGIKNADGEFESHPLYGLQLEADPVKFQPAWPLATRVESAKLTRREPLKQKDLKTCMVFPDVQIPFESKEALDVALQVMANVKPDRVVFLGDILDLSPWSKYVQQKEFADATQAAIVSAHQLLASIRKALPAAQIQVMAGNHEERLPKQLLQNAREAYGLKRADSLDGWPVMSVPYLCAFDRLDVDYIPGYPANRLWLNPNLQIRHGSRTGKKGAGARANVAAEKISTISGHDHRLSSHSSTINTYEGAQQIHAYGAGCLCRLDGHVPSVWQGRDLDGQPIKQYEDWQNGFVIATYDENNFHVEQVPIGLDHKAMFRGKIYEA
jgi:hypothetical protein